MTKRTISLSKFVCKVMRDSDVHTKFYRKKREFYQHPYSFNTLLKHILKYIVILSLCKFKIICTNA